MDTNRVHRVLHRGRPRTGKFAAVLAVTALLGAMGAAAGFAGTQDPSSCTIPTPAFQPFLQWHDQGNYFLAPGGSFEGAPGKALNGWSTSGKVQISKGSNESYYVTSPSDNQSLFLAGGSSATTPPICLSIHTPNLRFFAQDNGADSSTLQVFINYTGKDGSDQTAQVGSISAGSSWSLSPSVVFRTQIAPVVGGQDQTSVSFTFAPSDGSSWQMDDLYIDPLKSQDANGWGGGSWGGGW